MGNNSNNLGRAYEYAWGISLYNALSKIRKTQIIKNSSFEANKRAWETLDINCQKTYKLSSEAAVDTIIELEPRLTEDDGDELQLEFQKDDAGVCGDVRDIVIKRNNLQWEIGLSIKHNHNAIKHSRLSHSLDFGKEWFNIPCSDEYWDSVKPIFDMLKTEKSKKTKWSEIKDKENNVYIPLLQAFMDEVSRANKTNAEIPKRMVEYLIGLDDYYKAISHDKEQATYIQTFNIHGSLNKPSKLKVSSIHVPVLKLPNDLIALKFKKSSNNTVEMYLNNGWQLSFRIHNATTYVEPSLKFDIEFIGMPTNILVIECKWHSN